MQRCGGSVPKRVAVRDIPMSPPHAGVARPPEAVNPAYFQDVSCLLQLKCLAHEKHTIGPEQI
jgi:hypothetical protein